MPEMPEIDEPMDEEVPERERSGNPRGSLMRHRRLRDQRSARHPVACGKLDEGPTQMKRLEPRDRARPPICWGMRRPWAARWSGEVWCAAATAR